MPQDIHLMIDQELIKRIIKASRLKSKDKVLEIGSGTGYLTEFLLKKCPTTVIEPNKEFVKILEDKFSNNKNFKLIEGSIFDIKFPKVNKIVSNLPYSICEPLLWLLIRNKFELAVLTVPKKFSEKLLGEKSKLSILVKEVFIVELLEDVHKSAFNPQPKVGSAVIRIKLNKKRSKLKKILIQYDKALKNALIKEYRKTMTNKEAKEKVKELNFSSKMINTKVLNLSLKELKILEEVL